MFEVTIAFKLSYSIKVTYNIFILDLETSVLGAYLQLLDILLGLTPLDHYVVPFFVYCNSLQSILSDVKYCYSGFLLIPTGVEYRFPSPHF